MLIRCDKCGAARLAASYGDSPLAYVWMTHCDVRSFQVHDELIFCGGEMKPINDPDGAIEAAFLLGGPQAVRAL